MAGSVQGHRRQFHAQELETRLRLERRCALVPGGNGTGWLRVKQVEIHLDDVHVQLLFTAFLASFCVYGISFFSTCRKLYKTCHFFVRVQSQAEHKVEENNGTNGTLFVW